MGSLSASTIASIAVIALVIATAIAFWVAEAKVWVPRYNAEHDASKALLVSLGLCDLEKAPWGDLMSLAELVRHTDVQDPASWLFRIQPGTMAAWREHLLGDSFAGITLVEAFSVADEDYVSLVARATTRGAAILAEADAARIKQAHAAQVAFDHEVDVATTAIRRLLDDGVVFAV